MNPLRTLLVSLAFVGAGSLAGSASAAPSPRNQLPREGGNVGLGVSLGDPMGASLKWFMASRHALQFDLGWAPLHHGHGRVGVDYLWHPGVFGSNSVVSVGPYLGLGIAAAFWAPHTYHYGYGRHEYDDGGAAMLIRAPILGLFFHWQGAPIDTAIEGSWSPYVVMPDLPHGDVSFKLRYYF
jgi:hypothetical protein